MPRLFRQKLSCFYCCCRSEQEYSSKIRQWKCEKCDAVNYLDESGEITDPPALESFSEARYARAINPHSPLPVFSAAEENLFCARCLQNQKFLTEALASYFPPTNAPDYPEYEDKYPEFRKNLEARYPQVCHQCEPRVQARIEAAGYAARADRLGRGMERSRGSRYKSGWAWDSLLISAGALGWWASQIGLMMWNIQGSLTTNPEEGLVEDDSPSTATCLQATWATMEVTSGCTIKFDYAVGIALGVSLVTLWWNPVLQQRLIRRRGERIIGRKNFFILQVMLLGFRVASFFLIKTFDLASQVVKAINAFLMVIAASFLIISFRTTKLDNTPKVSSQNDVNTTQKLQQRDDAGSLQVRTNLNKSHQSSAHKAPLSLNDLAPKTQRSQPALGHPPTPPPEDDGADAMDWTPSQKALPPAKTYLQAKPVPVPSPFYGRLPPAPKSQAHKLRNPTISSSYPVPSERENFFNRRNPIDEQDEYSEIGTEADSLSRRPSIASPAFAPPRFFPQSNEIDTGLESIFSGAFNIDETPHEVRSARQQNESTLKSSVRLNPVPIILRLIFIFSLSLSAAAWSNAPNGPNSTVRMHLSSLSAAILVAFLGIMLTIQRTDDPLLWIHIIIYSSEIGFAAMIGSAIQTKTIDYDRLWLPGLILLCGMILQEGFAVASPLFNTRPSQTGQPPSSQKSNSSSQSQQQSPPTTPRTLPSESFSRFATIVPSEDLPHSKRVTRSKARIENRNTAGINTTPRLGGLSLG